VAAVTFIIAVGLACSLAFNVMLMERSARHATTLTHCINGGSFTVAPEGRMTAGRVVNCLAVDTHEGRK
jgi:hypothetical protein